jgi:plasmid replication initiation protein
MERTPGESPVREVGDLRARSLQPIRHPDRDFFLADLLDYAIKDDAMSMEAPIFTLATKPDTSIWEWESRDGSKHVRVTPSVLGRATQFDKDVLIYVISQLTAALNENDKAQRIGKPVPRPDAKNRTIRFRVYDYLVVTNRGVSGRDYMDLRKALERLRGTTITTDIRTGRKLTMEAFGIIDRAKIVSNSGKEGRMAAVEITISEWLFNAVGAYEVLTIHPDYFRLRKPLERRLYELARKHVGREKDQWSIGMVGLKNKTGSKATLREFRRMVKTIMLADTLPEFGMRVDERDIITFSRKVPFYS